MIGKDLVNAFRAACAAGAGEDTPAVRKALKAMFIKLYKDTAAEEVSKQVAVLIPRLQRQLQMRCVCMWCVV